jgi:hypothetical protein
MSTLDTFLENVRFERSYQDSKWGTAFDDKNTTNDWVTYINAYATKAANVGKDLDVEVFRTSMIKVAALAAAAYEAVVRNDGPAPRHYD